MSRLVVIWGRYIRAVVYWVQPPGVDFCYIFIVDDATYRGSFSRSGVMISGRNVDFPMINAAD